jgi:carboxymethylenebutenolidase
MCYDDRARPPLPPVRGGADDGVPAPQAGDGDSAPQAGDHGDLVLRSADGTEFGAYYAHPDAARATGIVILPDVRGLHGFYKELAQHFAGAGLHAVAIDYFGRTAGIGPRPDDFPYREHTDKVQPEQVTEDVGAAADWLRGPAGGTVRSVFTVGFCFGGAHSWRQSAAPLGLAGCIGFYGRPERAADVAGSMKAPLLLLAAGQDFTPVEEVERFADQVRASGVEAEMHVYPDAPHSFFDRKFEEHADDCADAWRRILDFVGRHRKA